MVDTIKVKNKDMTQNDTRADSMQWTCREKYRGRNRNENIDEFTPKDRKTNTEVERCYTKR